jgi:hypothetical protein
MTKSGTLVTKKNGKAVITRGVCRLTVAVLCAVCAAPVVTADPGGFQTVFYVTNTNDSGEGSLREAIQSANSTVGDDIISIIVGGQLILESLLPTITEAVTIDVPNPAQPFIIDGQDLYPGPRIGNVTATINGLVVQNAHTFGNVPGAGIGSDGDLTLNSVTVRDCATGGNGGGASAAGTLVVNGGLFEHNEGLNGGGLYAGDTLILTDTQIISNTANNSGGAYAGVSAQLSGGRFEGNHANNSTGGFYSPALVLSGTAFISNTASSGPGGVLVPTGGTLHVSNALFEDNIGSDTGGLSAWMPDFTVMVTDTSFIGNRGRYYSGGVWTYSIMITGGRFERNSAISGTGALNASSAIILGSTFISNTAGNGPIYSAGGVDTQDAVIANSWFENNRGRSSGGITVFSGNLAITSSVFLGNSSMGSGGGILQVGDLGSHRNSSVVNSLFAGNTANGAGAALYLSGLGTDYLRHVTIASSTPVTTSAIWTTKELVAFQNVIFANHAVGLGVGQGIVVVDNALFYDNGQPTSGPIASENDRVTGDPKFANPAAGDFHLLPGSAAIDSGGDANLQTDYDGDARPLGLGFDIGYDEFVSYLLQLPLILR